MVNNLKVDISNIICSHIWFSYIHSYLYIQGFIANPHNDQLPVGLLAQLVEHCTSISKVMGSILYRPEFLFSGPIFTTA